MGALTHVLRVEAGGAIFPLPFDGRSNLGFLAAPAAETSVQGFSLDDLSLAELNELSVPWIKRIGQSLSPVPEGLSLAQFHEWAAAELFRRRIQTEQEETDRLNRLVDNLLNLARAHAGDITIEKELSPFEDVVETGLARLRSTL